MKKVIAIAPLFLALVSCGSDEKNESSTGTKVTEAAYVGNWSGGCSADTDGTSIRLFLTINADKTAKQSTVIYTDSGCANAAVYYDLYHTLAIVGEQSSSIQKVNLTVTEFKIKYASDAFVAVANTEQRCGYSDWTTNTEKSCLGKTVAEGNSMKFSQGDKIYNVFSVESGKLYVGQETTTEAQRPTTISASYTKN